MKIALLKPYDDGVLNDRIDLPFSLLVLGTVLERAGHGVNIIELESNDIDNLPFHDIFGITSVTCTFNASMELARGLRYKYPESRVFLGGKHFWATSQDIPDPGITIFTGEADDDIVSAVQEPGQQIWRSAPVTDLDKTHPLAFHLVDLNGPYRRKFNGKICVGMALSRGCPYRCNFCHNRYRSVRCIKPLTFRKEVSALEARGVEALYLFDDNFLSLPYLHEYLAVCKESDFSILCLGRADSLSKANLAKTLKASNIDAMHVGVESGAEIILEKMGKQISPRTIRLGLNKAIDAGIAVQISLMVGFPGETWKTLEETVLLLKGIPFNTVSLFPFIPFPGCAVWKNPGKFGITCIDKDFGKYRLLDNDGNPSFVYETAELDKRTLYSMWDYMSEVFNDRIKYREKKEVLA
jgi:radical SAM superfamily enzyme YgiQ (UPF0313 family)